MLDLGYYVSREQVSDPAVRDRAYQPYDITADLTDPRLAHCVLAVLGFFGADVAWTMVAS